MTSHNAATSQAKPSPAHLLGVELVELCLLAVASPQTQHLSLGAVGHVDELLVPPALVHGADVAAQDDAVVAHLRRREESVSGGDCARVDEQRETLTRLHEEDVSGGVGAGVHDKSLLLDVAASAGPDGQLAAVLKHKQQVKGRVAAGRWRVGDC